MCRRKRTSRFLTLPTNALWPSSPHISTSSLVGSRSIVESKAPLSSHFCTHQNKLHAGFSVPQSPKLNYRTLHLYELNSRQQPPHKFPVHFFSKHQVPHFSLGGERVVVEPTG